MAFVSNLVDRFPDLSRSIICAVAAGSTNEEDAAAMLEGMTSNEPSEDQINRMVTELASQFQQVDTKTIRALLKENNWNIEKVFVPLINEAEQARRRQYELERKRREEEARATAKANLAEMFRTNANEIQKILDENDGDMETTTEILVQRVKKEEEQQKIQRERREKVMSLASKFGENERRVESILTKHNWDMALAVAEISNDNPKLKMFCSLFPSIEPNLVRQVLLENDCTIVSTQQALNAIHEQRLKEVKPAPVVIRPPEEALILMSTILSKEVEDKIDLQDPNKIFQEEVDATLRDNMVPGILGYVPLPASVQKEINKQQEEKVDIIEDPQEAQKSQDFAPAPLSVQNSVQEEMILETDAKHYQHKQPILVKSKLATATPYDWIGIYMTGKDDRSYTTYEKVTGESAVFHAPNIPGEYQFRYFINNTYARKGVSAPFWVGPKFTLTPTLIGDKTVKVEIEQSNFSPCPSAWVAAYEQGKEHKAYTVPFQWVGSSKDLTFKLPKTGPWEFRLFPERAYHVAATCSIVLKGEDSITLAVDNNQVVIRHNIQSLDPRTDNVWIGIYRVEEHNNKQYRRYKYVSVSDGELYVKPLKTPGTYEARLFGRQSQETLYTSNTIVVPDPK